MSNGFESHPKFMERYKTSNIYVLKKLDHYNNHIYNSIYFQNKKMNNYFDSVASYLTRIVIVS